MVLQVKPQYFDTILDALKPHILPSHLIVSIAAGIRLASLEAALPEGTRIVSYLLHILHAETMHTCMFAHRTSQHHQLLF